MFHPIASFLESWASTCQDAQVYWRICAALLCSTGIIYPHRVFVKRFLKKESWTWTGKQVLPHIDTAPSHLVKCKKQLSPWAASRRAGIWKEER
jgi:hypothetical protein